MPDANVLQLLSPFLNLPNTSAGQATLTANMNAAIATNNAAAISPVIEAVSISDKTIFGTPNSSGVYATIVLPYTSHTPPSGTAPAGATTITNYGPGANLGGGLPQQNIQDGTTNGTTTGTVAAGTVVPYQQYGGYGQLGTTFQTAVDPTNASKNTALINLLSNAYAFNSNALGVAKAYFANGTISTNSNGTITSTVVAPAGYNLPVVSSGVNSLYDKYYLANGYSKNSNIGLDVYGDSRPVQFTANSGPNAAIYDPQAIINLTTNPAFPSGHTTYAFTDSILLGMLTPQYFQSMLLRGSEYANSRIALGVHYPLDIIASRSFVQYNLAQLLNATSSSSYFYTNPAAPTSSSSTVLDLNTQFVNAAQTFAPTMTAAAAACGGLTTCAATNPYNAYSASTYAYQGATNSAIYQYRMTYGLPTYTFAQAPREMNDGQGNTAAILLATLYGGSDNQQAKNLANAVTGGTNGAGIYGSLSTATINQIIYNTEGQALQAFYGTQLSYWSRIDLYDAAGYFQNVTGTLKLASTDVVNTAVTVGSGGVLGGNGTVNGNVTFQAGGALGAQGNGTAGATSYTGLTATSATFQAGSKVEVTGGAFLPGGGTQGTYTVLTTTGGAGSLVINGVAQNGAVSPATVSVDTSASGNLMAFMTGQLKVVGDPTLQLTFTANFNGAAVTKNQNSVATAIDTAANAGNYGTQGATLLTNLINNNTAATAPGAFNSLSGEGITGQQQTALSAGNVFATTVLGQATFWSGEGNDIFGMKDGGSLKDAPEAYLSRARVWAAGFGQYASLDGQSSNGSANLSSHASGVAAGVDYKATPNLLVGLASGYSNSNFSVADRNTSGTLDGAHAGLYGIERLGAFYVAGTVDYAHYYNTTDRFVTGLGGSQEERGKFSSNEWLARFEGGYKYVWDGVNLTPFTGFQVAQLSNGSFSERGVGGGVAGLSVNSQTVDSDKVFAGLQVDTKTVINGWTLTPYARLSWEHEFKADRSITASFLALPGASFTVYGPAAAQDVARLNTGFKFDVTQNIVVFGAFDGEFSGRGDVYTGTGGVKFRW